MGYSRLSLSMDDSVVEKARRLSDKTALLPKANAVMLEKGAKLELKSGMVKVTSLTVDGKVYPSGVYCSSTSGGVQSRQHALCRRRPAAGRQGRFLHHLQVKLGRDGLRAVYGRAGARPSRGC